MDFDEQMAKTVLSLYEQAQSLVSIANDMLVFGGFEPIGDPIEMHLYEGVSEEKIDKLAELAGKKCEVLETYGNEDYYGFMSGDVKCFVLREKEK